MAEQSNQLGNRSRLRSVFHWFLGMRPSTRTRREARIAQNESGFSVFDHEQLMWSLRWDEACRVVAFKLDRFSYDTICFGFQRLGETDRLWCIEEDWEGYKDIVPGIERLTRGGWPAMFAQVAQPAFEFNWTLIWEQPDATSLGDDPVLIWFSPPEKTGPVS